MRLEGYLFCYVLSHYRHTSKNAKTILAAFLNVLNKHMCKSVFHSVLILCNLLILLYTVFMCCQLFFWRETDFFCHFSRFF